MVIAASPRSGFGLTMGRHYLLDHELIGLGFTGKDALFIGDDGAPVNAMHGGFGKWGMTGLPFTGWDWCFDRNGAREIWESEFMPPGGRYDWSGVCEMCDRPNVRWLHRMRHPDIEERLTVGWCCAGHLANDMAAAKRYEKEARLVQTITAGAVWIGDDREQRAVTGKFWMTVRRIGAGYRCKFWHQRTKYERQSNRAYATMAEAQRAVVRAVVKSRMTGSWK